MRRSEGRSGVSMPACISRLYHRGPGDGTGRDLAGRRITIVGDVLHSRVARSNVWLLHTLGAEVTLVAPPTLLPVGVGSWPVAVSYDLDAVRMAALADEAIVMHPGPMNRGMEIAAEVADSVRSTIVEQVGNGVSVRM